MTADLKSRLSAYALDAGFAQVGYTTPDAIPQAAARLAAFLDAGYHGDMGWLGDRADWRGNPDRLWPQARSVIMLADAYAPSDDPLVAITRRGQGTISCYAQNRDYHDVVKKRLKAVGRWLLAQHPDDQIKVFVDTAPVMEKPLGQAAGLGWQGKHTNLVGRGLGSWFFLGAIFTTVEFDPDPAENDHCGSCRACLDICPTDAFPAPYRLDARRCISYLTIEHKGPVDPSLRPLLGNRIYGCDDCLAVCPWNKFASRAREAKYVARPALLSPDLDALSRLDDAGFRAFFSGSPIKRIGRGRFVRNVLYAIGNSGLPALRAAAQARAEDGDPVVADAARWAIARLARV